MSTYQRDLELALALADAADEISLGFYRNDNLAVSTKPDLTPVTEADQAVEKQLRHALSDERPTDLVIGEEFGADPNATTGRRWVIDPIDGTKNYLRGVPVWATLIALAMDDELVLGVVSAPAMGRRWWALADGVALTRDPDGAVRDIRVSKVSAIADASFAFSDAIGWDRHGARGTNALDSLLTRTWRQRGYGDFWSHMLVAEGAVDIAAEPKLSVWDMAALVPIVNAAGGRMTGFGGENCLLSDSAITTNGLLHESVLSLLK